MNNRQELREFILNNIDAQEGIVRGTASLAATPFRMAATGAKTVGRTIGGTVGTAGRTVKAAGQLATLKPKKALGTMGRAGKSLARPITGGAKDIKKMVTKPISALRKGGVVY